MTFRPRRVASGERLGGSRQGEPLGDQRAERQPTRPGELDRPGQIGRGHPAGEHQGQPFPSGEAGREGRPVAGRDADQDDPAARPDGGQRVLQRVVVAGDLEGDVDRLPSQDLGPLAWTHEDRLVGTEPRCRRDPVGQAIRGHDVRRAGETQELDQEQTERSAAVDPGPAAQLDPGQVQRVEGDADGFEEGRLVIGQRVRQPVAQPLGPGHPRAKGAVGRAMAGESDGETQVRPTGEAWTARAAWIGGVDRDALARSWSTHDDRGEFVAEDQRSGQAGVADRRLLVPVQVRAAQADRADLEQHLTRGRLRGRLADDPDVALTVQTGDLDIGDRGRHQRRCP